MYRKTFGHLIVVVQSARSGGGYDLEPVVLHRKPDEGLTIIEKLERYSDVSFAFVLLTPDDIGYSKQEEQKEDSKRQKEARARQNVIFELGYFVARLGRNKVCCLYKTGVTLPTDFKGVLYKEVSTNIDAVAYVLLKELRAARLISGTQAQPNESQTPSDLGILRAWKANLTSNRAALMSPQRRLEKLIVDDRDLDSVAGKYPQLVGLMTDLRAQLKDMNREIEAYETFASSQSEYLAMAPRFLSGSMSPQQRETVEKARQLKSRAQNYLSMIDVKRMEMLASVQNLKTQLMKFCLVTRTLCEEPFPVNLNSNRNGKKL